MLNIGDRVTLTQDTLMDKAGSTGTVVHKYAPVHCPGAWYVFVQWDHRDWRTSYPYPDPAIEKLAH